MNKKEEHTEVTTELTAKASESLQKEVNEEIKNNTDKEIATANFNKAIGK